MNVSFSEANNPSLT